MTPVISVVGWHDTGKTAFVVALISELKRKGLRVATIKHTRGRFDIDRRGTDTWRHAQAGSDVVVISGSSKLAFIEHREMELRLDEVISRLPAEIDIVITEGYKEEDKPKIEITSKEYEDERIAAPGELIALIYQEGAVDEEGRFDPDTVRQVVELLDEKGFIRSKERSG